jgi:hypothetical protein
MSGPVPIGPIAQAIVKGLRSCVDPHDAPIPEAREREPEPRVWPQNRDERRNWWTNWMLDHLRATTWIPTAATEHFQGKHILHLTLQASGLAEFPHLSDFDIKASSSALYRDGGLLVISSRASGAGKSTFALWHLYRHVRLEAERLADVPGLECRSSDAPAASGFSPVWISWRRVVTLLKAQMGRPVAEDLRDRLHAASFLVLDDLALMREWEHGEFEELVAHRYSDMRRTICVVNVELDQRVSDVLGPRVQSFLSERGASVQILGDGFRVGKTVNYAIEPTPF